ncbi:MAG: S41 family peptidase [Clostridiales bacterium]|nr:S41 family peptidase [Clostridiales bacterium]
MKKRLLIVLCLILCLVMLAGCTALPVLGLKSMFQERNLENAESHLSEAGGDTVTISKEEYERYQKYDTLLEIMAIVEENYYEDTNEHDLLDGAAAGMLSAIGDPYTYYYTAEEYAAMWEDDEGEYAGVGILISADYTTGICTAIRIFTGSPAEKAGVLRGDILYKVEDLYVTADNLDDAVDIMRGTPGTDVKVTFLRDGEERETVMTRAVVSVNRVESGMLEGDIGYIYLYEFAGDCAKKFTEAVENLTSSGAKGFIIDLRDNPGGWVSDAETIGDLFLDKGLLYYIEYKDGTRESTYSADGKVDLPLVVLVNENSASSSEILTGALKDRANATVVGVQSYGKGIIQAVTPVGKDGAGMQLTIAQYFTPNGNKVHKIGITPDIEVKLPEGDPGIYEFGDLKDPQLKKAWEVMKEKIEVTQ